MEKYSISEKIGAALILFGIISLCISWFLVYNPNPIIWGLLLPFFLIFSIVLTGIGAKRFLEKHRNEVGLTSFILAIIMACYFVIWFWSSETQNYWDFFGFSVIIPLSLGSIAILYGILSITAIKPRNKFGLAGLIITISSFLVSIIFWIISQGGRISY